MAENLIGRVVCYSDSAASFDQYDVVSTFYEDTTDTFVVKQIDYSTGSSEASTITSGGIILTSEIFDLGYYILDLLGPTAVKGGTNYSSYQFCESETLVRFGFTPEFPYFKKWTRSGDPRCKPAVTCDVVIIGSPIVTKASTSTASDGQIAITASGSRQIKFTTKDDRSRGRFIELPTATNNGDGTYTYTFTSIPQGQYTITAIDSEECQASRTVIVGYNQFGNYGLYRWFDFITEEKNFVRYRCEILKNNYDSSATEIIDYGDSPVTLTWNGENKGSFQPWISSEISVRLMNNTNFEYIDLFTQSDSEYLVKIIEDPLDASSLTHQAFVVPQLYSEPYIDPPYETELVATDRLGDLESFDFYEAYTDPLTGENINTAIRGLNSVKDVVLNCLKRLNTGQSIRVCFNLYEVGHDASATNDPLDQTYVNTDSYYDDDGEAFTCDEVIETILTPLGSRLFSSGGYWYLCRVEELKGSTLNYREFDLNGVYVTNGTINPLIDFDLVTATNRAVFGPNVTLGIEECYGKITLIKKRDLFAAMIPPFNGANVQEDSFSGWSTSLNGDTGSILAQEVIVSTPSVPITQRSLRRGDVISKDPFRPRDVAVVKSVEKEWALRFNIDDPSAGNAFASTSGVIEYYNRDSFQILISYQYNHSYERRADPPFVKLKWRFKVDDYYLQGDGEWTTTPTVNEYFVDRFDEKQEFTITALFAEEASAVTTGNYDLRIYDVSPLESDLYTTSSTIETDIQNHPITGMIPGFRLVVAETDKDQYYYYELRGGSTPAVGVNIVDPAVGDATYRWHLVSVVKMTPTGRQTSNMDYFGVTLNTFPDGESLEEEVSESVILNSDNLRELEIELFHFDLDTDINNAEQNIRNYFKLSDGTATGQWGPNNRKIQKILENTLAAFNYPQGDNNKRGAFRLNGSFYIEGTGFQFFNTFRNSSDNNRIYLVNGCSWDIKKRMMKSVELVEMGSSTDTVLKAYEDAAYSSGYS